VTKIREVTAPDEADGWPGLTYKYVMHYFWEPQHLLLKTNRIGPDGASRVERVRAGLMRQEVPVNYLLNLFLRLSPASMRAASLKPFGVGGDERTFQALQLRTPRDAVFTQPDVLMESDRSRVLIELKVGAKVTLTQIWKYVRLHRDMDNATNSPRKYVLLLTQSDPIVFADDVERRLFTHHQPTPDGSTPWADIAELLETARPSGPGWQDLPALDEIRFGLSCWQHFAANIDEEIRARGLNGECAEILDTLGGDFLADLRRRGLYVAATPE
jgi:hypothetical protein